ncbi:MAG: GTPase RsgA, partial [Firmicutes bacterium]|nr:GTPase RsgA [Bacillota bacterium]
MARAAGGFFTVRTEEGESCLCRARGKLKRGDDALLVGDRVLFEPDEPGAGAKPGADPGEHSGVIEGVLPRRNVLLRPPVANVEQLVLVLALKEPLPDWQLAGRILLQAEHE